MFCARLNLRIHISRQKQTKARPTHLNTASLCKAEVRQQLASKMAENLKPLQGSLEEKWASFKNRVQDIQGCARLQRAQKDRFDVMTLSTDYSILPSDY